ncbi:hypothetical protein, partial [Staphylococcus microti]
INKIMKMISFNEFTLMHINRTVPNWMIKYYSELDDVDMWVYFESYNTLRLICLSEAYLHDALKFVLKNCSNDLIYDFYVFLMFDESIGNLGSVISSDAMSRLNDKYDTKFEAEFNFDNERLEQLGDFDIGLMDNLPF